METTISPYILLPRDKWADLRDSEPLTLTYEELAKLKGIDDELSIEEVRDVYLPISRLLSYYVEARANRQSVLMDFLKEDEQRTPFVIGIAGSVSVGKSTTARVLQALLSRQAEHRSVALVTTDGFLYSNAILEEKGLMSKKGFPESYNIKQLIEFVTDVKSGKSDVKVPIYSHLIYDIVPEIYETVNQPDILILEGLNVLQSGMDYPHYKHRVFVSDFLDFSIYVDADKELLEQWYVSRFLKLRKSAFTNPDSYFHNYTHLSDADAVQTARTIWQEINSENLSRNIQPTRERADLILHKSDNHAVDYVRLRK